MTVVVLAPVLDRPHRVTPLVDSLEASTDDAELWFLASPGDEDEHEQIRGCRSARLVVVEWEPGRGDYARKMNAGYAAAVAAGHPWVFLAGDDIVFHAGWVEAAMTVHEATGACVVGTNDLGNPKTRSGQHSTHTLVHAEYAECGTIDDPTVLLHEGYWHNWVDTEFVETAIARGTFASARDSIVEHLHPFWNKGETDATYELGRVHYHDDRRLFETRRRLWK